MSDTVQTLIGVLLVEDDEDDFFITRDMLERAQNGKTRYAVEWCRSFDEALGIIVQQEHDIYLIDYRLGERTGLDLVREAFASRPRAPVVMLTGQDDYEVDFMASQAGITDFMLKRELNPGSLERTLRYALSQHQTLRHLAASEERYALAARAVNDGIWDWDITSDEVYFSPRWQALLGLPAIERRGVPPHWFDLVHPEDLPGLKLAIDAHLTGRTSLLQFKHRMRHADGSWRWMLVRGIAVDDGWGEPLRMAGSLSDITAARVTEHQLQHDALHDALTGLPNRALFMDRLERALLRGRRNSDANCAVLFLDMDRFKLVNDTFSHSTGDRLLVAVANRITHALRPGDTVSRIAGDEFAVLLDDLGTSRREQLATEVAVRVRDEFRREFDIDGNRFFVTMSVGVALPEQGQSAADLLRNADIAMYEAKRRGRDAYAIFDQSMHRRIAERLANQNDLRQILEMALLEVHYQPVIDLTTGRIHGFEALARWPNGWPPVPPSEFIPIAEETGLISRLGAHVLNTSLSTLAGWRRQGLVEENVAISVNVSGRQLDEPDFPDSVLDAIAAAGLPARTLHLEITEGTLMREPERMSEVARDVCAAGVSLELDDFGTGYSSLSALHSYPVSALKIDKSFVSSLTDVGDPLVRSTVALGHSLGLQVIAEGIEEMSQLQRLRSLGCEYGQGYYFSAPRPADEIEALLKSWTPAAFSA